MPPKLTERKVALRYFLESGSLEWAECFSGRHFDHSLHILIHLQRHRRKGYFSVKPHIITAPAILNYKTERWY